MSRPRIRSIKPEMFADEAFGTLNLHSRLLFVGLITMADDEGRLRALPSAIIGHVFPYDDVAPSKLKRWLAELIDAGLIVVYEVSGLPYAWLRGWAKHQRVNRPTGSSLPPPPHDNLTTSSLKDHGASDDAGALAGARAQAHVPIRSVPDDEVDRSAAREAPAVNYQGRRVAQEVVDDAVGLLVAFNEAAERALGAWTAADKPSPALKQIIGAMLLRPEVSVEQWEAGIKRMVESPPSWVEGGVQQVGQVFGEKAAEWALAPPSSAPPNGARRNGSSEYEATRARRDAALRGLQGGAAA